MEILIASSLMCEAMTHLEDQSQENCVVFLTKSVSVNNEEQRLICYQYLLPKKSQYSKRSVVEAELEPSFVAEVTQLARKNDSGLIFVHTHPGDAMPNFSIQDDYGELLLAEFLSRRIPNRTHAAIVVSKGGMRARELGTKNYMHVIEVGKNRIIRAEPVNQGEKIDRLTHDRQIRAFGELGQKRIGSLSVGIVGLGGTGSVVSQQLAYLGVRKFVLIDHDTIDASNLNRLVSAQPADIGRQKAHVVGEHIVEIQPCAEVRTIIGDVTKTSVASELKSLDIIFGCTDSHGSRAVLQQIAYQYLVPVIDMGVVISSQGQNIDRIIGRAQLLAPSMACFTCSSLLDSDEVRRDMMTPAERKTDPYILGANVLQPSVVSINTTIASLAVTMFIDMVAGIGAETRHLLYDAQISRLKQIAITPKDSCYVCSAAGMLARGDSVPLITRNL